MILLRCHGLTVWQHTERTPRIKSAHVCKRTEAPPRHCYVVVMKHPSVRNPLRNQLIDPLNRHCHHQLLKHGEVVELSSGHQLNQPGETVAYAYFPAGGVIALIMQQPTEKPIALTLVGAEGMVSIASVLGVNIVPYASQVLISCEALRIPVQHLYDLKLKNTDFCKVLDSYVAVMHTQFAQAIVCHSLHNVQQRMASLLLTYSDRVSAADFAMTQALLASLLGVRRSGINKAASMLQQLRTLQYSRGHMYILNRTALLKVACPCYANDKLAYLSMMSS